MNRILHGVALTAMTICSTLSCSQDQQGPTGIELDDPTAVDSRIASAIVTLAQNPIQVGATTQATAALYDRWHNRLRVRVIWRSSDSTIARVSDAGLVTGVAAGSAAVIASRGTASASAEVTVVEANPPPAGSPPVATVSVSLTTASVNVGQTTQATATLRDANNNVLTGRAVVWSTDHPTIATVDSTGTVKALAAGSVQIIATSEGQTGSAPLTVAAPPPAPVASVTISPNGGSLQVGETLQLSATTRDANNNVLTGRVISWSSSNTAVASVGAGTGLVTGAAPGSAAITATSEGKTASVSVTVASQPTGGTAPDLASHDFNDGTYGVFQKEDPDGAVSIVDDPTGAGRGKVVRIHYVGTNQDRNRSVMFDYPPGIGLGKTIFSRQRVYHVGPLPTNTLIGRKYLYWQEGSPSLGMNFGQPFWSVVGLNGTEVAVDLGHFNAGGSVAQTVSNNIYAPKIQPNTWYTVETQMTVNSTPSSNDGIFRLWINGVLIYEKTNWRWTDPNWPVNFANFGFHWFLVGEQMSYVYGSFDEVRLIDDVAFSTKRIGQ